MATRITYSARQVQAGFAVGHMTIHNWRKGTAKQEPLPCAINDKGHVTFAHGATLAWAKKHGRRFDAAAASAIPEAGQPGPKVTAKVDEKPVKAKVKPKADKNVVEAKVKVPRKSKVAEQASA